MVVGDNFCSGAPLLGAAESVKALMIGVTFGLPIPEVVLLSITLYVATCLNL
jgi:hypothetical protein